MTRWMCVACGTQYEEMSRRPTECRVCTDDRQYLPRGGQRWTTLDELASTHRVRIEDDEGLVGVGIDPSFAIPQRALLVDTSIGTVMWDCVSLVTADAVSELTRRGGVSLIAISHPHFYSSMVEWSDALGGVPVLLHEADREWVVRSSPRVQFWSGDRLDLGSEATLLHLPGHFPGSSALWHRDTVSGRRRLLAGDSLHVCADRRHVSFMHSVPNHVPLGPPIVRDLRQRLAGVEFDDVYGFTWGLNVIGDARAAVDASFDRTLAAMADSSAG